MPLINILRLSEDDATRWFRLDEDDELVIFIIVRFTSTTKSKISASSAGQNQTLIIGRSLAKAVPAMVGCTTDPECFTTHDFFALFQSESDEQSTFVKLRAKANPDLDQARIIRHFMALLNPDHDCSLIVLGNDAAHPSWRISGGDNKEENGGEKEQGDEKEKGGEQEKGVEEEQDVEQEKTIKEENGIEKEKTVEEENTVEEEKAIEEEKAVEKKKGVEEEKGVQEEKGVEEDKGIDEDKDVEEEKGIENEDYLKDTVALYLGIRVLERPDD